MVKHKLLIDGLKIKNHIGTFKCLLLIHSKQTKALDMERVYEFLLILLVGLFVYIVIDNTTDQIILKNNVDESKEAILH